MMRLSSTASFLLILGLLFVTSVRPAKAQVADLSIDTRQSNAPISKYIYGQFIEHLGRCIYGGLWAEMLEDRKFYFPVTGEAPAWTLHQPNDISWEGEGFPYEILFRSPWMIYGPRDAVTMVTENPFVGDQTPRITVGDQPGGLFQGDLALIEGRDYTGRIWIAGGLGAAPIQVSLVWGRGAHDRQTVTVDALSETFTMVPLAFTANTSTENGRLEIIGHGQGAFSVGTVSLMPADNLKGWRTDTVALLKELDSPVYRWPGGNFVSGYDWKDGIGDIDRRPPRKNPAWKGIEHNDVGIHEFMDLMQIIDAEAFIAVNTGLGGPEGAAEEVEYLNGSVDTPMGTLRAENGHPLPYDVAWWAVGNEMYGDWQLGHMPLSEYVLKHNEVVDAMREVDDALELIGVGHMGEWSQQMLTTSADHMSLISEHLYWQDRDDLISHVEQITAQIQRVADAHRGYRNEIEGLTEKDIRIAMDEWNYWYGANEYGELGVRYHLQDALGIAAGLHAFFRNSDIYYMANYAQTVNVIGAIKTTKTEAELESTGLVLKLYRHRFGTAPLTVETDAAPLNISAALTEDGTALTIAVINPTEEARTLTLNLTGSTLAGKGQKWVLTGKDRWAHNAPGKARGVDIEQTSFIKADGILDVAPLSVTLYSLDIQ